jgi:Zn-dependent protease
MFGEDTATFISYAIILFISLPAHELAHAAMATAFGDPTPRAQGRLTFNPLKHLDPFGSIMLLIAGFGWAKPVQVDPYILRQRSPAALALVSVAGPGTNLLLALVASVLFRLHILQLDWVYNSSFPSAGQFFSTFVLINLVLMLFNLIPIAPLDGEEVLAFFLPSAGQRALASIRPYGMYILLALILVGRFGNGSFDPLGTIIFNPATWLARHLIGL